MPITQEQLTQVEEARKDGSPTLRPTSLGLELILHKPFPVLEHGFVRVVDYMGNESNIVRAARVSYGKGTTSVSADQHLLRYLMRHRHGTPFEMAQIQLHVKVPMDAWRQWIRHRTASVNEYSTRYSAAITDTIVAGDQWRKQGKGNKQGSFGLVTGEIPDVSTLKKRAKELAKTGFPVSEKAIAHLNSFRVNGYNAERVLKMSEGSLHKGSKLHYECALLLNVAREVARKDLPLGTYTEAYWCVNLRNLLHFLSLRMDSHAQKEIRDYANVIGEEILSIWMPNVWKAFQDYSLESTSLSALDTGAIESINTRGAVDTDQLVEYGWAGDKSRERDEFLSKAANLGFDLRYDKDERRILSNPT